MVQRKTIVEFDSGEERRDANPDLARLFTSDETGRPVIERPAARIADLEHRLDYLERTYDPNKRGNGAARHVGEIRAVRAGIEALRHYQRDVQVDVEALTALRRLVRSLDESDSDGVQLAMASARRALSERQRLVDEHMRARR